ncbi:YciI family protein [Sphingobium algorifonticola]|uniref:GTP cyclohydrolase n=1 Tax=Sphingobium algorifonticola TaxID=2008318 RepID=A0A437JD86_9SPHN|nr:YciI family protein [Sphingobium algorifonticola]RVT43875.1 GTP cyclohydrolase [Sphingobium algorifonticola]
MFIIALHYTATLEEVDAHLDAHVAWLHQGIADGWLMIAGRQVPRTGGILIARGDRDAIVAKASTDPFVVHGVADVTVTEFTPSIVAPGLDALAG